MCTLILMRHGKSGYPAGIADHERPLADRGAREAGLAGDWLRAHHPDIDAVLCSTSTRTRQTLAATGVEVQTAFEPSVYDASPETLLELLRLTDDAVRKLLVVGHFPGMPALAWELAADRRSPTAVELSRRFPTSALAVLHFDTGWSALATADLVAFHVPR
jgi:phosphohistidine phosphatase